MKKRKVLEMVSQDEIKSGSKNPMQKSDSSESINEFPERNTISVRKALLALITLSFLRCLTCIHLPGLVSLSYAHL